MIYEIINPSDCYTIEAQSLDVAFVACVLLGSGQYSFSPLEDGALEEVPLFLFGGSEEWANEHFGKTVSEVFALVTTQKRVELADCFDSCLIGHAVNRAAYTDGLDLIDDPAKREQWRARWHDKRRSSMNDIGGRAYKMAANLRAGTVSQECVPQQVFAS